MSSSAGSPNSSRYVEFDEYVDLKLQKTRSTIKTTDLLVALAGVAAMFLGYLLVFVVLDQWVVPGGFGIVLRWLLLSTLLLLTVAWLGWKVGLPYLRTVNRLYAAREIEKADPELQSNLLNLVDLRDSGREVNPTIMRTLEKRAAVGLQKIDVTQAVDNRQLMYSAYVLLVVVVLFSLYAFFSPKKISNSILRSLFPSANVGLATRTEILVVRPGDMTILAGEKPEISAEISGEIPEKVTLFYSSIDGAYRDQPVEMRPETTGGTKFATSILGDTGKGVLQDLTYVVKAGDAVSHEYHIHVKQPPQASGHQVKFEFPAYMKLEPVEQAGGQIDTWEGAKVTVTARTNMPVKRATVELLDDPTTKPGPNDKFPEYSMSISSDGRQLSSTWTLAFNSDGSYSKAYRIQCWTENEKDPSPIVHSVTIRPDQPPEVAILEPVRDLEAPANSVLPLLVEARDPDFELSHIHLHIKKNGQAVDRIMLSEGRQQRALLKFDLKLDQKMALNTGDQVEIFVEAFDNKQPRPNRKSTPELKIKIVEPISPKEAEKKLAEDKKNRDQKQQEAEQEQNPDQRANPPMQNEGEEKSRDNQPQNAQPNDPKQNRQQPEENQNGGENGGQGGNSGKSGKKANNSDKGDQSQSQSGSSKEGSNQQKQPGQQDDSKNQPLNPDGDEDGEALKKVLDKLGGKPPRKSDTQKSDKPKDEGNGEGTDSSNEPQSKAPKEGPGKGESENKSPKTEKSGEPKKDGMPPTEKDAGTEKEAGKKEAGDKSQSGDDPKKTGESSVPMPMPEGAEDSSGKPEKEQPPKPGASGGNEKKEPNPKTSDGKSPPPSSKDGEGEAKPGDKQEAKPGDKPSARPGDAQKKDESNEPGKPGDRTKPDKNSDPMKKPGNQEEQQPGADGSEKKQDKTPRGGSGEKEKEEDKQTPKAGDKPGDDSGTGSKSENKPAMKDGEGKPGDKPEAGDGPRERTNDTNDAKREKATGDETGPAKADHDPNAKPTPSKNPGLERDPKEKPATRPADPKSNDPSNTKSGEPAPTKPKPPGDKPEEKTDQQENNGGKPAEPKRTEKRDGEPKAPNEPKKGDGLKDQRSDAPDGGQGGSKKQDAEGNKGSKDSGKGDQTNRPGEEQAADKKTNQPGGKSQPGSGKKSEDGNGEKKEGEGSGDSPDGKSMPKEFPSPEGEPSRDQDANSDQKQQAGGDKPQSDKTQSDKKNSKKDPSGSDKSKGDKSGKEKQPGGDQKPGGEQKKDGADSGKESSGESGEQKDGKGDGKGEGKGGKGKPGSKPSDKGGGEMKPSNGPAGAKSTEGSLGNGKPNEGGDANSEPGAMDGSTLEEGDEANLEYTKQATELVLKRLQDQLDRGDVDPELLKELGWTDAEMRRFTERMTKYLQESKSTEATPESLARRQQFEEMLKSLELKKRGVTRPGEKAQKREIDKTESRQRNVSPEYRSAVERISKELNRQKSSSAKPSK